MEMTMEREISSYVENHLKRILGKNMCIDIFNGNYVVNNYLNFKIYEFWNKNDKELIEDFLDYSFEEDYIGTIFFFLSGYWEYIHNNVKDNFGRFPATESFQIHKNILEYPVVDILIEEIRKKLNLKYLEEKTKIFVTHDIDFLGIYNFRTFTKSFLGDIIKRKNFRFFLKRLKTIISGKNPFEVFNLIDLHKKYNTKGTFFFMPRIQPKKFGGGYNVSKNITYLKKLGQCIIENGCNIGIHYDVRYMENEKNYEDIRLLEKIFLRDINIGRAHYLIFDIKKSFQTFEKCGIKVDSTCCYADRIGFRFGTCKPFMPYNFFERREYTFYEYPLIIMDTTLNNKKYMNMNKIDALEKAKMIIDQVDLYKGTFTFLWHNTSFFIPSWEGWEKVYEEILRYCKKKEFEFI